MHQQILKAVLVTASLASFTVAHAETTSVPSMMNFQGYLTKPDSSPDGHVIYPVGGSIDTPMNEAFSTKRILSTLNRKNYTTEL